MRYLLVLHNAGTEMRGIASWLAAQPDCNVMLAMDRSAADFDIPGIEKLILKKPSLRPGREDLPEFMLEFMQRAEKSWYSLKTLAPLGRVPDIILANSSTGTAFGLRQLFPDALVVNYLTGQAVFSPKAALAMGLLQTMQTAQAQLTYAFSERSRKSLPEMCWKKISLAPLAVDTDWFTPPPPSPLFLKQHFQAVVLLSAFELSEYIKWFNAIIKLAAIRPRLSFAVFAPNNAVCKASAEITATLPEALASRIRIRAFPGREARREVFGSADLALSPAREITLYMLEAMSCAVPVLSAASGNGLIAGENHVKLPPRGIARLVDNALANLESLRQTGARGRKFVERNHGIGIVVPAHVQAILEKYRQFSQGNKTHVQS